MKGNQTPTIINLSLSLIYEILLIFFFGYRTGTCTNSGSVVEFNPDDVTIEMQNSNEKTFEYLNQTLNDYLDFLKIKSSEVSGGSRIKISVDIGKI